MKYSFLLLIILSSCTYNELIPESIEACELEDNPSFADCVQPIINIHCINCHNVGSTYGELITYEDVRYMVLYKELVDRIQRDPSTDDGFMPQGEDKLSQSEISILVKWENNETPNN